MSSEQWAALQRGDESYVGSPSYFRFEAAVKNLFDFKHAIPTRANVEALERLLTEHGRARVPLVPVLVTVTNNSRGGQPVRLENLQAVRASGSR